MKYELIKLEPGHKFYDTGVNYQIRALKDIESMGIRKGDLGGYVNDKDNLSQEGNCWIFNDSRMFNNSRMYDNSKMHNNSMMFNNSEMHDNSEMYDNARMYNNSKMHNNTVMFNNSEMHDNSEMYGKSRMFDSAVLTNDSSLINKTAWYMRTKQYSITISSHIQIGCKRHTYEEWMSFTDEKIDEMEKEYSLKWWKSHKELVKQAYIVFIRQ